MVTKVDDYGDVFTVKECVPYLFNNSRKQAVVRHPVSYLISEEMKLATIKEINIDAKVPIRTYSA